jgi:hypothetical protein
VPVEAGSNLGLLKSPARQGPGRLGSLQSSRVVDGLTAWSSADANNRREFASLCIGLVLALDAPAVAFFNVAPIAANLECGQLPDLEQAMVLGCTFRYLESSLTVNTEGGTGQSTSHGFDLTQSSAEKLDY